MAVFGGLSAVTLALLSGCATTSPDATAQSKATKAKMAEEELVSQVEMEERAQALAHFAAGLLQDLEESPDKALDHYSLSAQADPKNEPLIEEICRRYLVKKEPQKALEVLERTVTDPAASATIHAWHGFILSQLGKTNEAIAASKVALKKDPKLGFAYQNLFQIYSQSKNQKEALKLLEQGLKQPEPTVDFLVQIVEMLTSYRQLHPEQGGALKDKIIAAADRAVALKSPNLVLQQKIADVYIEVGAYAKAEPILLELLKKVPALPGLREKLILMYVKSGDQKKIAEQMQIVAKDNPASPQAYFFLGTVAQQAKKYDDAVGYFEKVLILKPDFEPVYYDLATLKITLEKPEEALKLLEEARGRFTRNFLMEFYSGLAEARLKNFKEAIRHYTEAEIIARATNPKYLTPIYFFQVGAALERSGKPDEAEKSFRKCLEQDPDFTEALNYMGYMWAEKGIRLSEAKTMIEKALKLEPDSGAILDSMGWVLFKMGQTKEALGYLLKSVEKNETVDGTIQDHLGDVYAALKQFDKARGAWEKSLKAEDSEEVRKKLNALQQGKKPGH